MPQRCIETQSSDSPLVGTVQVSRDTDLFKWMPHGEGTYYKAVTVKVDLNLETNYWFIPDGTSYISIMYIGQVSLLITIRLSPRPFA